MSADPLENCIGFDWDEANAVKNWELHQATTEEAEDVFFHDPLVIRRDFRHSKREKRYYALGQTRASRRLFVVFTIRRKLIRVISVRDMNRNEASAYERMEIRHNMTKKKLPEFKTEDRERNFWATADSTEYLDWPSAKRTKLVRLKPTLKTISLRLPLSMIEDLKILANRRDVPYQSLLKVFLAERLARERQPRSE